MKHADLYFRLARERWTIHQKRLRGEPPPWTADPILARYRFCNVFREDDKTTAWFRSKVRDPLRNSPRVLLATVAFRWFNRIETGEAILPWLLGDWDPEAVRHTLAGRQPITTGAFMVKTPPGLNKLDGLLQCIDNVRQDQDRLLARIHEGSSLQSAWFLLREFPYLGNFMAYEIVSDLRHTKLMEHALDIDRWACAGPGCARGLGWVLEGEPARFSYNSDVQQEEMCSWMREIVYRSTLPRFWPKDWPKWEMREAEHWSCEVWKYVRCRDYGQPPKQLLKVRA